MIKYKYMKKIIPFLLLTPLILCGCKDKNEEEKVAPTDFSISYKENFKILHLTDTQIIDPNQCRTSDRLNQQQKDMWKLTKISSLLYDVIDQMVEKTKPDLITLGGDNVYGEFDDNCSSLTALRKKLDTYKIPYTYVYGNHDNECAQGRAKQNEIWAESKYCMYRNGINSIGLYDENKVLKRQIFMVDSNGCGNASEQSLTDGVTKDPKLTKEQRSEFVDRKESLVAYGASEAPSMFIQNIMPKDVGRLLENRGIIPAPFEGFMVDREDCFGGCYEELSLMSNGMMDIYEEFNCDNAMFGHDHVNNLSALIDDVRYTYMMKSSYYDYYKEGMIGGTLSTISNDGKDVKVEHVYYNSK